jgi:hypothetical protein
VVAICEDGVTRSAGRVPSTPDGIGALAESLLPSDRVALEVTGSCWEVCRILEPHVNRAVVVSPDDTGIANARAKTDRLDARTLSSLLWRGELEAVWMPDERCRILRRRLARRAPLVHARTRSRNEIHAALQRRLQGKPPCSDLFGVKGRRWLAGLELPPEERESVDAAMRHVEFVDAGDRGGGEADRQAGVVVAGDPAADDRWSTRSRRLCATPSSNSPAKPKRLISDSCKTSSPPSGEESGRERDTGARIDSSRSKRGHKSRGRPSSRRLLFATSVTRAHHKSYARPCPLTRPRRHRNPQIPPSTT